MTALRLVINTVTAWVDDGGPQLSAAIAYYSVLSLAPFVILVSALAGIALGDAPVSAIQNQLAMVLGQQGADFALSLIQDARVPDSEFPGLFGNAVILLVGATILFANVQGALNRIWGLKWIKGNALSGALRQRLLAFAMIFATGLLMLVSVALSTVAGLMTARLEGYAGAAFAVSVTESLVSVVVLTLLFAATFRILPDGTISWKDVLLGALVTAVLFVVGKVLVAFYLTNASVVGAYGVAGSLVFFLIWVYYSAAIFFLGAEFTEQWARHRGRPIRPEPGAVRMEHREVDKSQAAQP